jgi:hypothetical protein
MKILAIDLGKYKSVACNYVTATCESAGSISLAGGGHT